MNNNNLKIRTRVIEGKDRLKSFFNELLSVIVENDDGTERSQHILYFTILMFIEVFILYSLCLK